MSQHKIAEDAVLAVAWPTSDRIISGCIPGTVQINELEMDGDKVKTVKKRQAQAAHTLGCRSLTHSSAGDTFVSGGLHDSTVILHASNKQLAVNASNIQEATCLMHSPASLSVAAGTVRGTIRILGYAEALEDGQWSFSQQADISTGQNSIVNSVAYSPDGSMIVAACGNGSVVVVSCESLTVLSSNACSPSTLRAVEWSKDGREIYAAGDDHRVYAFDGSGLGSGAISGGAALPVLSILGGHTGFICALAAMPTRPLIATSGNDRTIRIWDARKRECVATFEGAADKVWSLAWRPDGRSIAAGTEAGTLILWTPKL
jgi:WD40 repeat protein